MRRGTNKLNRHTVQLNKKEWPKPKGLIWWPDHGVYAINLKNAIRKSKNKPA